MVIQVQNAKITPINTLLTESFNNSKNQIKWQGSLYQFNSNSKQDFSYIKGEESHAIRRKIILQKHPQIKKFMKADKPYSLIITIFAVFLHLLNTYMFCKSTWTVFILTAYFFGASINRTLHSLIHDLTHNLGHSNPYVNKFFAILCNVPTGIPGAIIFGKYHAQHHNFMSLQNRDTDLPLRKQAQLIKGKFAKYLYICNLAFVYLLRPLFFKPLPVKEYQHLNTGVLVLTNMLIYKFMGMYALLYMILGIYFSLGMHIGAMHLIAQHFEFVQGLETYDYIGPFNILNLNVGYHTQHHDFPNVPWYYLPQIRKAAPQFYQCLPYHTSYLGVMLKFILDDGMDSFHRIIRIDEKSD